MRIKEGNSVGAETRLAGHLTGGEWGPHGRASLGGTLQAGHLENQRKIELGEGSSYISYFTGTLGEVFKMGYDTWVYI